MIYELDNEAAGAGSNSIININGYGREMEWALMRLGCNPSVPAVFIGGKFVGSASDVMTLHINGSLKKMLKDAGALWL